MKKIFQKIPKRANIKCPHCSNINRINVPEDSLITSIECKKCKQTITTPIMKCCIICAFSNTKCPYNLKVGAKAKGLILR